MAKKGDSGKKKKGSGAKKALTMAIVMPLIITILICSIFFAILDGIIGIITGIVTAIANFFSDPIGTMVQITGTIANGIMDALNIPGFTEAAYNDKRLTPKIFISEEQFNDMADALSSNVDREKIGLDNITLKKLLLTYYRTMYTVDTTVLIQITQEDIDDLKEKENLESDDEAYVKLEPFKLKFEKEPDTEENKLYLTTTGVISFYNGNDELQCYTEDGLKDMYAFYYDKTKEDNKANADAVKKYLKKCYTVEDNTIKMIEFRDTTVEEIYKLEPSSYDIISSGEYYSEPPSSTPNFVTLDYTTNISSYTTPVEFMVDLMEITGSKHFIDTFIDLIYAKSSIKVSVKDVGTTVIEKTETTYTQNASATGTKEASEFKVKDLKNPDRDYIYDITIQPDGDNEDYADIVVTIATDYKPVGDYRINLERNGEILEYTTMGGGVTTPIEKILNSNNNYKVTFDNIKCIKEEVTQTVNDPETRIATITSIKTTEEIKYDLWVREAATWYGKLEHKKLISTRTSYHTKDAEGNSVSILNEEAGITNSLDDESIEYEVKGDKYDNYIFEEQSTPEEIFIDHILENIINDGDDYDYTSMKVEQTNKQEKITIGERYTTIAPAGEKFTDTTDDFLALLQDSEEKPIEYDDIYGGKAKVGDLLVNGDEMLFELLDSSYEVQNMDEDGEEGETVEICNTMGLSDVMRWILQKYTGKDYGVTELGMIRNNTGDGKGTMTSVTGGATFWWPIGSADTETIRGKLYAKGEPVSTKITSGVGPRWETYHDGIDIAKDDSVPGPYVVAAEKGTVTVYGKNYPDNGSLENRDGYGYGNHVIIDHGNGYTTMYAHMAQGSIVVNDGEVVEKGQVIGRIGHSGMSTGPHLHFEVKLNGEIQDPEEYVSPTDSRPEGVGGISQKLYLFVRTFEGGTQYYDETTKTYTVFNNGLDDNLELTCGVGIGTVGAGAYDSVRAILGRDVAVGSKITADEYNKILTNTVSGKLSTVEQAMVDAGVTLTQTQKDAVFSFCYNASDALQSTTDALVKYKNKGDKGYWEYIHDYTNDGLEGLVRRRAEEMELFLTEDYSVGSVGYGLDKHKEYNKQFGFPENEGS